MPKQPTTKEIELPKQESKPLVFSNVVIQDHKIAQVTEYANPTKPTVDKIGTVKIGKETK